LDTDMLDIEELKESIRKNDLESLKLYGIIVNGNDNVEYDPEKFNFFFVLTEKTSPYFHDYDYGSYLEYIRPSIENYQAAFKHFKLAAEKGDVFAQLKLGLLYEEGFFIDNVSVVEVDYNRAVHWYTQSSWADKESTYRLGRLMFEGKGTPPNQKKGFRTIMRAACWGSLYAIRYISNSYLDGIGCKRNYKESYIWALVARTCSIDSISRESIDKLEHLLSNKDIDQAQDEAYHRHSLLKSFLINELDYIEDIGDRYISYDETLLLDAKNKKIITRNGNNSFQHSIDDIKQANTSLSIENAKLINKMSGAVSKSVSFHNALPETGFKPSEVSIVLCLSKPKNVDEWGGDDRVDIDKADIDGFLVIWNGLEDHKDKDVFKDKILFANRNLMLQLAFYKGDDEKIKQLLPVKIDDTCSRLNTMFKELFTPYLDKKKTPFIGTEGFRVGVTIDYPDYIRG
jgi:hypothetical protein